jgi:alanine racemase
LPLFESFSALFKAASWPTYSSMSYEAALKMTKKILQKSAALNFEIGSCTHPSWIEIDLGQFKQNISIIRRHIGSALFCLPVKANAYGHGLCVMGKAAEEAGVDYLAVAHLQEGVKLRLAGIKLPILVLGAIHQEQIAELLAYNLELSISSQFKADLVAAQCGGKKCRIHLEVDTGMQRTGVRPSSLPALFDHVQQLGCFEVVGIYSHLARTARVDAPYVEKQIKQYGDVLSDSRFSKAPFLRHIAGSSATSYFPASHFDMVRPSLLTFGYLPDCPPETLKGIAPCFSVKTKVSYFKVVEAGQGIGYEHQYITSCQTRIVTIPIGYGDGYRRCLSNRARVLIRGKRFPIVGKICMDQCMVDIGDGQAYVGDEVVLIGKQGNEEISLKEIATLCDTNLYEVLCFFNERLPRVYTS